MSELISIFERDIAYDFLSSTPDRVPGRKNQFGSDPKGRNAGWAAYLYYGGDEALARDVRRFGARGGRSDLFSGNIQYKWNQWVTFAYEQGYYRTRADFRTGLLPLFRGVPSYTTHNIRSEFAAIFTF